MYLFSSTNNHMRSKLSTKCREPLASMHQKDQEACAISSVLTRILQEKGINYNSEDHNRDFKIIQGVHNKIAFV